MRGRAGMAAICVAALAAALAACSPTAAPSPPPPTSFTAIPPPMGASAPGTSEWYWAPAPSGHAVTLGVYRPSAASPTPPITVLLLNGGDGYRRVYEDLAQRL